MEKGLRKGREWVEKEMRKGEYSEKDETGKKGGQRVETEKTK